MNVPVPSRSYNYSLASQIVFAVLKLLERHYQNEIGLAQALIAGSSLHQGLSLCQNPYLLDQMV